jgi:multiple antibiotic resistance protein
MPFMPTDLFVSALVTMLVVVDPIGLVPIFLSLTAKQSNEVRRRIALRASIIAGGVLTGFALIGQWLLIALSVTLPAFRIAGGLLLFAVAFDMVLGWRSEREGAQAEQAREEHARHIAAFPLAIPLMAGPGAVTATLLLAGRGGSNPVQLGLLLVVIATSIAACYLAFRFSLKIDRVLGVTGNIVLSRLLGILLAALAVQFVIDGVRAALSG